VLSEHGQTRVKLEGIQSGIRTLASRVSPTTSVSARYIPLRYKWPVGWLIIATCRTNSRILGIPDTVTPGMFAFGWHRRHRRRHRHRHPACSAAASWSTAAALITIRASFLPWSRPSRVQRASTVNRPADRPCDSRCDYPWWDNQLSHSEQTPLVTEPCGWLIERRESVT